MKALPTVIVSSGGEHALVIVEFDGVDHVPNRDATAYYFDARNRDGERVRVGVLFSGTVFAVRPESFGLPPAPDRESGFQEFAMAAIGDHLDVVGMLAPTPPSTSAHWIECFSPHFQEWADREPADDAAVERYLSAHLFEAWSRDQATWECGAPDSLRLARPMETIERIIDLGDGETWSVVDRSGGLVELKSSKKLIRAWQAGDAKAVLPITPPLTQEDESVSPSEKPASFVFVDESRLADLRRLESTRVDLRKVIALCEELNFCYRSQCYHAVAALTRALVDHVPPVFGFTTFRQVTSNYAAGKSLKACLSRLQGAARDIADMHLHQTIRKTESLPTRTQVNFSHEIDMLLAEIVRVLEEEAEPGE